MTWSNTNHTDANIDTMLMCEQWVKAHELNKIFMKYFDHVYKILDDMEKYFVMSTYLMLSWQNIIWYQKKFLHSLEPFWSGFFATTYFSWTKHGLWACIV
jgi:hypothetical protein